MLNIEQNILKLETKLNIILKALMRKEKPFMSINECAEYLGISRNTIYQWTSRKQNTIPHYKIGKKLMFKISEIDGWILNKKNKILSNQEIESEAISQVLKKRNANRK